MRQRLEPQYQDREAWLLVETDCDDKSLTLIKAGLINDIYVYNIYNIIFESF